MTSIVKFGRFAKRYESSRCQMPYRRFDLPTSRVYRAATLLWELASLSVAAFAAVVLTIAFLRLMLFVHPLPNMGKSPTAASSPAASASGAMQSGSVSAVPFGSGWREE